MTLVGTWLSDIGAGAGDRIGAGELLRWLTVLGMSPGVPLGISGGALIVRGIAAATPGGWLTVRGITPPPGVCGNSETCGGTGTGVSPVILMVGAIRGATAWACPAPAAPPYGGADGSPVAPMRPPQ
jgi:hypothetical protein